jgi:hypothetical protein
MYSRAAYSSTTTIAIGGTGDILDTNIENIGTTIWMQVWWITECIPLDMTGLLAPTRTISAVLLF